MHFRYLKLHLEQMGAIDKTCIQLCSEVECRIGSDISTENENISEEGIAERALKADM